MRPMLHLMACVLLIVAEGGKDKDKQADDSLMGTWKVVSLESDGRAIDVSKTPLHVFKDGKMRMSDSKDTYIYKLDPSKKPATLDFYWEKLGAEETHQGIYELKGDELKWCYATTAGFNRPKEFTGKPGYANQTLKRVKNDKP